MTTLGAKKKRGKTPKEKAWKACSRYIRLRDAIAYCLKHGIDLTQFNRPEDIIGKCCTCGKVKSWIYLQAGHWKGRDLGGKSGTYFDERNIHP
jgi:5-methylcytosine-specific restriction endonuclease McrA